MKGKRKKLGFFIPNVRPMFRFRTEPPPAEGEEGDGQTEEQKGAAKGTAGGGGAPDLKALQDQLTDATSKLETSQKSYVELQKTLQKKDDALKVAQEGLTALQSENVNLAQVRDELTTKVKTFEDGQPVVTKELTDLRLANARARLIISEFPHLAGFETKELIPASTDAVKEDGTVDLEKIRELFTKYSGTLNELTDAAKKEYGKGGSKEPGGKQTTTALPSAVFLKAAQDASLKGEVDVYNDQFAKYLDALEKEKATAA